MSRKYTFSKEYQNWPLKDNEHLNITLIESHGRDLEDLLVNATMYLTDWHGNEGPDWDIGDLSSKDYDAVVRTFAEFLAGAE